MSPSAPLAKCEAAEGVMLRIFGSIVEGRKTLGIAFCCPNIRSMTPSLGSYSNAGRPDRRGQPLTLVVAELLQLGDDAIQLSGEWIVA